MFFFTPRVCAPRLFSFRRTLTPAFFLSLLVVFAVHAEVINVPNGGDLQAALDRAQPGDTLMLEAGAVFEGPFYLPAKQGSDYITLTTSAAAQLPAEGVRVTPAHAALMPKLIPSRWGHPALSTNHGAHHYRIIGIEFTTRDNADAHHDLITLGDGSYDQHRLDQVAHHLVIDRCYIHGKPGYQLKRGIALNSAHTEIINSYISEVKSKGYDSQAICGWNGPGPFKIINNQIEASTENVLFGGADAKIPGLVPSDIEFRLNTVAKPLAWRGVYQVKNLFQLKNAQRVLVEGNVFENNWGDAQTGYAIAISPRNQEGDAPWSVVQDVDFRNNIVRHTASGINLMGQDYLNPSQITRRIRFSNNLFDDIDGSKWYGEGVLMLFTSTGAEDITFEHNTALASTSGIIALSESNLTNLTVHDNVMRMHVGKGGSAGTEGLQLMAGTAWAMNRNVVVRYMNSNYWANNYPTDNFYPAWTEEIGFINQAAGDFRLSDASPYKGMATDGKDIGCDFDQLQAAMAGRPTTVVSPTAQRITEALNAASQLVAASAMATPEQLEALAAQIEAAQNALIAERNGISNAVEIEARLKVANYFTRAALALARSNAAQLGVQSRVSIAAAHLERARSSASGTNSLGGSANLTAQAVAATAEVPQIRAAATRSGATFAPVVAPASAAVINLDYASGLSEIRATSLTRRTSFELEKTSVTVAGVAAGLTTISSTQIGLVVPASVPTGEAEVVVTTQHGEIARGTLQVVNVAPGIFTKGVSTSGIATGKRSNLRGQMWRRVGLSPNVTETVKMSLTATGFSFAALNSDLTNDTLQTDGTRVINLAESVGIEARAADGRVWKLAVEFAGQSLFPGVDEVRFMLPAELRQYGTLELTIVVGTARSNVVALNFATR